MIGPDGRPDLRVNACLGSAKWRRMAWRTRRDYAYSLLVWLNYLITVGASWWEADDEVASEFLFWRVTDPANEDTVETGTFARDLAGLKKFYKLAARFRVLDPFADMDAPRIVRHVEAYFHKDVWADTDPSKHLDQRFRIADDGEGVAAAYTHAQMDEQRGFTSPAGEQTRLLVMLGIALRHRGQGGKFADEVLTDALYSILDSGPDSATVNVLGKVDIRNIPSQKMLTRAGFQ